MIRLFAALAMPATLAERLVTMGGGLPGARWLAARNLHLTLRFFGEIDEVLAEELHHCLGRVRGPAPRLALAGLGTFGSRQPGMLWAGVRADDDALGRLQARVESAAQAAGLAPEPRKFTPHVTLARLKSPRADRLSAIIASHGAWRTEPMAFDHFTLFRSHLGREGAEYEALHDYPLMSN